jgi:hypothetical protein
MTDQTNNTDAEEIPKPINVIDNLMSMHKEEREAMPDLAPDLSMIPPPEYRPSPRRGMLGSNSDAGKLYDLYNKFNLDRINNAKRLGVNSEGLKKILGEDLYNKYRNLR